MKHNFSEFELQIFEPTGWISSLYVYPNQFPFVMTCCVILLTFWRGADDITCTGSFCQRLWSELGGEPASDKRNWGFAHMAQSIQNLKTWVNFGWTCVSWPVVAYHVVPWNRWSTDPNIAPIISSSMIASPFAHPHRNVLYRCIYIYIIFSIRRNVLFWYFLSIFIRHPPWCIPWLQHWEHHGGLWESWKGRGLCRHPKWRWFEGRAQDSLCYLMLFIHVEPPIIWTSWVVWTFHARSYLGS